MKLEFNQNARGIIVHSGPLLRVVTSVAFFAVVFSLLRVRADFAERLTTDSVFAPDRLLDVRIELPPEDWNRLRDESRSFARALGDTPSESPFTYLKGTVIVNGFKIEDVGIRKKGFIGSLDDERPSLKIHFSKFKPQDPIPGLNRLTLNNNKQDRSLVSQFLTYRLFNAAGAVAPRCNHAKVTVNGVNLGIYSNVESIKSPFLKQRFGNSQGQLHEGIFADFFPDTIKRFEAKKKHDHRQHLADLARLLSNGDKLNLEQLNKTLDVSAFVRFWALESLLGCWDGYTNNQNNFFVYANPGNAKLYFIPWGADSSLTGVSMLPPYVLATKSVHSQSVLANRLYRDPAVRELYRETLEQLLTRSWNEKEMLAETERIQQLVTDHLHSCQDDFAGKLRDVRRFIESRRQVIRKELKRWPLPLTKGPRRPVSYRQVGSAHATFDTQWAKQNASCGAADVQLTIDNQRVAMSPWTVTAEFSRWPTGTTPRPPTIVFKGNRRTDGKRLTLVVALGRRGFQASNGREVHVHGMLIEGALGFLNPRAMKMVSGMARLDRASLEPGENVRGSVQLKVMRMIGGESLPLEK